MILDSVKNIAFEIDHGMQYLSKALGSSSKFNSEYLAIAYGKMLEAKELLVSYIFLNDHYDGYWESNIPSSLYIEDDLFSCLEEEINVDKKLEAYVHVKFLRLGSKELCSKLKEIISDRQKDDNVYILQNSFVCLQIAYIWLREELLVIKAKNPKKHSSPSTPSEREVYDTGKIIEKRTKKKLKNG